MTPLHRHARRASVQFYQLGDHGHRHEIPAPRDRCHACHTDAAGRMVVVVVRHADHGRWRLTEPHALDHPNGWHALDVLDARVGRAVADAMFAATPDDRVDEVTW